jgi:hypothetical protein
VCESRCVFGLYRVTTGSFSFECARLAFGCASPCHCSAFVSLVCRVIVPFATHR